MIYLISLILIFLSALCSGLTLGYFSLNVQTLRRQAKLGNKEAQAILPVRVHGNQLLTTLLFGNVAVNAVLSIYLSSLTTGAVAAVFATALIFIFGEIIPQAAFARHAMWLCAKAAPFTRALLIIMTPLTWPVARILNLTLGHETPMMYSKHELMEIISEHEDSEHSTIDADEKRIIHGALQFSHMTVREVMTPKANVASFEMNERLTDSLIKEIAEHNYSRYPVYSGHEDNIVGILFTKELLSEADGTALKDTREALERQVMFAHPADPLDAVLGIMLKKRQHMAIVKNKNRQFLGVITLEDIIEEIIQVEIDDEGDA